LPASCGFIHGGGVPLAATRTLESRFHKELSLNVAGREEAKMKLPYNMPSSLHSEAS
jgi:hypothetical protein